MLVVARANVSPQLRRGPLTVDQAPLAGLTRRQLEGRSWRRIRSGLYAWAGLPDGPLLTLGALHLLLPAGSAFSGLTAWWLHGLDVKLPTPVEATPPYGTGVSARAGLSLKHGSLPPDMVSRLGLPVT
jgi:hypothetical protein